MISFPNETPSYIDAISKSSYDIYTPIMVGDPKLWIPTSELQDILDSGLKGLSLQGLALRTRSKVVKEAICRVLGYPVPKSFKKTKPRYPGQNFDTYTQKSNNLQVWNDELSSVRRYVLIQISPEDTITRVKVVTGDVLALLDTTGTLTSKYQARCVTSDEDAELVSNKDTAIIHPITTSNFSLDKVASPLSHPKAGELLPIAAIFERLKVLVGTKFKDAGSDQERNRGAALHNLVCKALGYKTYQDDGQFPDIKHQLLEIKLQTSPTIDLGIALPSSEEPIDVSQIQGKVIRHCDVRYAIFYAKTDGTTVTLTHLMLVTGEEFFKRFTQFQGKVSNSKIQMGLPKNFFSV